MPHERTTDTPTPDRTETPPAAPLTAEEIAGEPMCRCEGCGTFWMPEYPDNDENCIECGGAISRESSHVLMEIGVHAALRDRLARAEARCVALRRWVEAEIAENDPPGGHDYLHGRQYALTRVVRQMDALLATPTDGAARAGDAAGEEGETT